MDNMPSGQEPGWLDGAGWPYGLTPIPMGISPGPGGRKRGNTFSKKAITKITLKSSNFLF